MTKMKKNISGCLCEQRDLRAVSPYFALCAVCWRWARKVSVKTICSVFERLSRFLKMKNWQRIYICSLFASFVLLLCETILLAIL